MAEPRGGREGGSAAAAPRIAAALLLSVGDPGALVSPAFAERFAAGLTGCEVVHLGAGAHHLQEDRPDAIGRGVAGRRGLKA